jgi:ATP-dependent Clp protease ATP-binding subunit ClpA
MSPSTYLEDARVSAEGLALSLHADAVSPEHLICVLLSDEESALSALVEHAFADPETLHQDALALAPGILVVGSGATRPFSVRAVWAARRAVELAEGAGLSRVSPACVLKAACEELSPEALAQLNESGCDPRIVALEGERGELPTGAHLFHPFNDEARRTLTSASRLASKVNRETLTPADLVAGALSEDAELARSFGADAASAAALLRPFAEDTTPPEQRALGDDEELTRLWSSLSEEAGSLEVLDAILREPQEELAQVFLRQKVTAALLERSRETFVDP